MESAYPAASTERSNVLKPPNAFSGISLTTVARGNAII